MSDPMPAAAGSSGAGLARLALNRFGLGAGPGDVARIAGDPLGWLLAQAAQPAAPQVPGVPSAAARILAGTMHLPDTDLTSRLAQAVTSPAPLLDRLALFWSNHLCVSALRNTVSYVAVPYENEAIRPFVTRRFADMLRASQRHPAMLYYLDLNGQIGPHSPRGGHAHGHFNEDYARELMELHTVGPIYAQADVDELALALSGWAIDRTTGLATYDAAAHEPGPRSVLGNVLAAGDGQADAAIDLLARHPATARRVCAKLAAHFLGDSPSAAVVAAMAAGWGDGGELPAVYQAMLRHPQAWRPAAAKFKNPERFAVSAARAMLPRGAEALLLHHQRVLGQSPFRALSPQGFPDTEAAWLSPGGVLGRVDVAVSLAQFAPATLQPMSLLAELLAPEASSHTVDAVRAAPSRAEAFALLLASPEFQRS